MLDFIYPLLCTETIMYLFMSATVLILVGGVIITKLSSDWVLLAGLNIFYVWLFAGFVLNFFFEPFGIYMLHWFLSMILYYAIWLFLNWICEKWGKPYMGEGGMVILMPAYLFIATSVLLSLIYLTIWGVQSVLHLF